MDVKNKLLFESVSRFVQNGLVDIKEAIDNNKYCSKHYNYPKLSLRDNGLPDISTYNDGPIEISKFFFSYGNSDPDIKFSEVEGFNQTCEILINLSEFKERFLLDLHFDNNEKQKDIILKLFIVGFLERYYHEFGSIDFNGNNFREIYILKENYIYNDSLIFDIAIPILFTFFDFDYYKINDQMYIRKIGDSFHLSRISVYNYSPAVAPALISSATHELILESYNIKNINNKYYLPQFFADKNIYPLEQIDSFFNSIKIVTGINTGYAQILIYPQDWATHYLTNLPQVFGTSLRSFPSFFEDFYWNSESVVSISISEMQRISNSFNQLINCNNNKIKIAGKRLRNSCLRENDEDIILDLIIALEILLSDGEKSELTHKLALRIAALIYKFKSDSDPIEIFKSVKSIYSYRSSIVHGSKKASKNKEIIIGERKQTVSSVKLAEDYLCEIIKILLENQRYFDPTYIDQELLIK